ncbi:MAG: efflux RND transporter periplasmic adaptor subunit [Terriglobia bacterium]|nr:efflux RND transporter periplasmic adaptor subunit [Terriglobia bacterium]
MRTLLTGAVIACVAASAALIGCSSQEKEQEPVVTVQTATARKTSIEQVISTEAVLYPKNQAAITPKVVAPVRKFYVNRGAHVHKGQLLAVLENRDIAASVTENKGALEQAQASYETTTRATLPEDLLKAEGDARSAKENLDAQQKLYDSRKSLFEQGALPRKDLDSAAVALAQAREQSQVADQHLAALRAFGNKVAAQAAAGQLSSAQGKYQGSMAQLSYTEIRSPINGIVTDRPLYAGETPPAGQPLMTVMDTSSVIARAHIPQEQAALLNVGDSATISAPEVGNVPAKVTIVSPALDPGSTTVEVWVEAPNKSGKLRPGSSVEVRMVARKINDAIVIPKSAILKTPESETTVMVVGSDNRAHKTVVQTGVTSGDEVQITKSLNAGQTVITVGAYGLPDNTQVKVAEQQPAKPSPAATEKE